MPDEVNASRPMYRPSHEEHHGMDGGLVRTLFIAGGIAAAGITGYAGYTFLGHSSGTLPIVQADNRPIRVKPEDPGGMAVTPEAKAVNPNDSSLAPGTEEPISRGAMLAGSHVAPPPSQVAPVAEHPRTFIVQLVAVRSEADARAAWEKLEKKAPQLTADKRPLFLKTNEPGPTPWRLRAGGFSDQARAKSFCDQVKAKGGTCAVIES